MTRKTATIGLSLAMPIVAIFTFGLRVQARRIQKQRLGADDWTLFVALLVHLLRPEVFILSLPVFEIAKLHMPLRRKAGVAGIFLLGMLVVIAGVIRTVMLVQAEHAITNERYNDISCKYYQFVFKPLFIISLDNYAPIYYWTVIETSVGVISACLPTLWPVFAKVSNRIRKVSDSARSTIPRSYPHSKLSEDATVWPKENSSQKGLCNSPNAIDNGPLERGDETSIDGISSKGPHGIELKMLGSHGYPSSQQDKTIIV
ncbi:MAG: hypothetical protein M1820_008209 [Bogoriella megaspora]|nr:MAG: hypothetical protein M1820_008209 [Bogoriella megaspora]